MGWGMASQIGAARIGRVAASGLSLIHGLTPRMMAVALGSLAFLGSRVLGCALGSEDAMHSGANVSTVQVTTDKLNYRPAEPIIVSIVNPLSVPIYALSGQTYCTIVTAQRSEDGQWSAEGRCLAFAPPGWTEIVPGGRTPVEVKPRLAFDRPLAPGRHRVLFTFNIGSPGGSSATVFSPEFLISDASGVPSMTARTSGSHRQIG
jgi:hypothetical protein